MLSKEQKEAVMHAPRLPLSFLLELHPRDVNRRGWPAGTKDSAIFFRLWDLFDCLRDSEAIAALTPEQRAASESFHDAMTTLPWRTISEEPLIKELPDDDLTPLLAPGRRLYDALGASDKKVSCIRRFLSTFLRR